MITDNIEWRFKQRTLATDRALRRARREAASLLAERLRDPENWDSVRRKLRDTFRTVTSQFL